MSLRERLGWVAAVVLVAFLVVRFPLRWCSRTFRGCHNTILAEWFVSRGGWTASLVHAVEAAEFVFAAVVLVIVGASVVRDRLPF